MVRKADCDIGRACPSYFAIAVCVAAICLTFITTMLAAPAYGQPPSAAPDRAAVSTTPRTAPTKEPKPELERPTVWGEPTEVRVGIYVLDIDDINSAEQSFSASIFIEAHWNIPALRHKGPGPLHRSWSEVWTPRLVIFNQQQAWSAFPETVEIAPDGEVIYRQKTWGRFSQPLNLFDFPLDRQTLAIQIVAAGLLDTEVKMVPLELKHGRKSGLAKQLSIPDFKVLSWSAEPHSYVVVEGEPGTAGYRMQIEVERSAGYFLIKVIIPLCLILIMSWVPRWIDPEQISANLGISATSFLTLIAYLFAITVLLPRVSYITRMDRFILMSTMIVFVGLLQTTATAVLIARGKLQLVRRTERWSRAFYFVALLVILGVSFWT